MDNLVITVARGFGSGGKRIASAAAKELGIHCYENRILTLASQLSGLDEELFVEVNEKLRGKKHLASFLRGLPNTSPPKVEEKFISDEKLFEFQKKIINQLSENEDCVIVGKCADWVLKEHKQLVSIYIEAPWDYCISNIQKRMQVDSATARRAIEQTDKYRADYYQNYTGKDWKNPLNYDLTINSDRVGFDRAVQLIVDYTHIKYPNWTPQKENGTGTGE